MLTPTFDRGGNNCRPLVECSIRAAGDVGERKPMAGPKTAFLVTAHDQPLIARRLLDRLDVPWARTFVHVDRKVDIRPFQAGYSAAPFPARPPARAGLLGRLQHRAGDAQHDRGRARGDAGPRAGRDPLGVDYPIKPLGEIGRFFARHPDDEFMRVDRDVNPNRTRIHDWYIRRRFLGDNHYFNPKSSPVPALAASARLVARMFPRRYIPGLQIYHGGCWWSLSRRGLDDLVGYFRAHPDHLGLVPPGPLGGRARLPDRPQGDAEREPHHAGPDVPNPRPDTANPSLHGVHYIDWRAGGPHPKNLTLEDLPPCGPRRPCSPARRTAASRCPCSTGSTRRTPPLT